MLRRLEREALEVTCVVFRFAQKWQFLGALLDWLMLFLVSVVRLFSGYWTAAGTEGCKRPAKRLELYAFENCGACRKVRETLAVLALDYSCLPCPVESLEWHDKIMNSRFRPVVLDAARNDGRAFAELPFLVDEGEAMKIFGAAEIVSHLWRVYGSAATQPLNYRLAMTEPYCSVSMLICRLLRPCPEMGTLRAASFKTEKPIEIWTNEASWGGRRVREVMSILEISHVVHCGTFDSAQPARRCCGFGEPCAVDANVDARIVGSKAITAHVMQRGTTQGRARYENPRTAAAVAATALLVTPLAALAYQLAFAMRVWLSTFLTSAAG